MVNIQYYFPSSMISLRNSSANPPGPRGQSLGPPGVSLGGRIGGGAQSELGVALPPRYMRAVILKYTPQPVAAAFHGQPSGEVGAALDFSELCLYANGKPQGPPTFILPANLKRNSTDEEFNIQALPPELID